MSKQEGDDLNGGTKNMRGSEGDPQHKDTRGDEKEKGGKVWPEAGTIRQWGEAPSPLKSRFQSAG